MGNANGAIIEDTTLEGVGNADDTDIEGVGDTTTTNDVTDGNNVEGSAT